MNLLTDKECEIVAQLSKKPELIIDSAGHGFRYYGVDRKSNKEDIELLEEILIKWCPDLISFSNFTANTPPRIRIQIKYSEVFTGVHYLPLPTNKEDPFILCRRT